MCARPPASARARWSRQSRFTVDFSVRGGGPTGASAGPSTDKRVASDGSLGRVRDTLYAPCMHAYMHTCIHTHIRTCAASDGMGACLFRDDTAVSVYDAPGLGIDRALHLPGFMCLQYTCVCVCTNVFAIHVCVYSCVCNTRVCVQVWTREQKRLWRTHCVENTFYSSVCGSTRHAWTHERLTLAAYRRCVCVCVCVCVCLCACGLTLDYNVLCIQID